MNTFDEKMNTFDDMIDICTALGQFAEARSKVIPDKDVILDVQTVNGREKLTTTRVSQMSWGRRFMRFFGRDSATLTVVAAYLQNKEPYLAKKRLMKRWGSCFYHGNCIHQLESLSKERLKELRSQKTRGCEIFKRCLAHHNQNSLLPVYIVLKDRERTGLKYKWFCQSGIRDPMCRWDKEDKEVQMKFRTPKIAPTEHLYLPPNLRTQDELEPQVLGFCYEYGIGVEKDLKRAEDLYDSIIKDPEKPRPGIRISEVPIALGNAYYSISRLWFKQNKQDQFEMALQYLTKSADIICARYYGQKGVPKPEENEMAMVKKQLIKVYELRAQILQKQGNDIGAGRILEHIEKLKKTDALESVFKFESFIK